MHNRNWILFLVVPLAIILVIVVGRLFYYNSGLTAYTPPDRELPEEAEIDTSVSFTAPEAVDNPPVSRGVVVIDYSHQNALFIEELNTLLSRVVSRGFSYEIILPLEEAASETENSDNSNQSNPELANKLRYAHTLVLPLPRQEYTPQEINEIENFVEKGGRLLIIGDPTRTIVVEALNSIAGSFGIIYANDYLYSLDPGSNDNNYRNVIYTNFKDSPLTQGLGEEDKIIFYASNSIKAPGHEIILGNQETFSSISEAGRTMAPAVLTTEDQVLALGDLTFLGEPYNAAGSNDVFISNMADFLTGGQRDFELTDFPYFFNSDIEVVFHNTLVFNSQFGDSVKLKDYLESLDRSVTFADEIDPNGGDDLIFVGRFDEAEVVEDYLTRAGIAILDPEDKTEPETVTGTETIDVNKMAQVSDQPAGKEDRFIKGRIQIEGIGDLERGGSTLFYLDRQQGRNSLIVLSENPDTNADAFQLLLENGLKECQVTPAIAVCQTQEPDGALPPSLRSVRIDKILVVSSDSGRPRADAQTSFLEFNNVLSDTYDVDTWVISENGSPDIDELLNYDAVIWSTGDYWDDSIAAEDAALLLRYVEIGGNLILSGASIAFDWDHTEFLNQVVHAEYLGFAEQSDLAVTLPEHSLAEGFAEGDVISFTNTPSGEILEVDVVNNAPQARVVFQRGPDSEESGAASVIAYEDDRAKIAYFAFPIYLLPSEQQDRLINNTISWFTEKQLELPEEQPEPEPPPAPEEPPEEEPPPEEGNGENGNGQDDGGNGNGNGNGEDTQG